MSQNAGVSWKAPTYRTFKQFRVKNPWATDGGLRWLRFNQSKNGFSKAFVTIGRRVLIDEEEFFRVVREQNSQER